MMLTNDKRSNLHWVITIQIVKFFEAHFEAISCNLLINKEETQNYAKKIYHNYEDVDITETSL